WFPPPEKREKTAEKPENPAPRGLFGHGTKGSAGRLSAGQRYRAYSRPTRARDPPVDWIRDGPDARARGEVGDRDRVLGRLRPPANGRARGPVPFARGPRARPRIWRANVAARCGDARRTRSQPAARRAGRAGAAVGNIFAAQDRRG